MVKKEGSRDAVLEKAPRNLVTRRRTFDFRIGCAKKKGEGISLFLGIRGPGNCEGVSFQD